LFVSNTIYAACEKIWKNFKPLFVLHPNYKDFYKKLIFGILTRYFNVNLLYIRGNTAGLPAGESCYRRGRYGVFRLAN